MTPNRFEIEGRGPGEFDLNRAFDNYTLHPRVGVNIEFCGQDGILFVEGLRHRPSASGFYQFWGQLYVYPEGINPGSDRRFDIEVEGEYDAHEREGWFKVADLTPNRLVHTFGEGDEHWYGGWSYLLEDYVKQILLERIRQDHRGWEDEQRQQVRYFVEKLVDNQWVRVEEIQVLGHEDPQLAIIEL